MAHFGWESRQAQKEKKEKIYGNPYKLKQKTISAREGNEDRDLKIETLARTLQSFVY